MTFTWTPLVEKRTSCSLLRTSKSLLCLSWTNANEDKGSEKGFKQKFQLHESTCISLGKTCFGKAIVVLYIMSVQKRGLLACTASNLLRFCSVMDHHMIEEASSYSTNLYNLLLENWRSGSQIEDGYDWLVNGYTPTQYYPDYTSLEASHDGEME